MMERILRVAKENVRIRAVYMNGSRVNPRVPKDIFQDYDIIYVVTETLSFLENPDWIRVFGDLLILQEPDRIDRFLGQDLDFSRCYGYLMLFSDGNRIDLHIQTKEATAAIYGTDSLTLPLLDKDGCLPQLPPPSDAGYHVKQPEKEGYDSCCNEFWWCLQNVAKGLWREELPYAKGMFEGPVRAMLDTMAAWQIGLRHDFNVSAGKLGKYFKKYLSPADWELYKKTYAGAERDAVWESVFAACRLFRSLAKEVGAYFQYVYPAREDENMTEYLLRVRALPPDAKEIF